MIRVLLMTLMFASPAWADGFKSTYGGVWHGVGIQIDGIDWAMEVSITDVISTVAYPTLACGGEWETTKVGAHEMSAIEHITFGNDICLDAGLIRIEAYDDFSLFYRWYDRSGKIVAGTILLQGEMRTENYDALLDLTMQALGNYFIQGPTAQIDGWDDKQ